jgi:hypothetical protein
MDIVLNILKQLSTTLSPTEFLMVLVIIAFTAFSAARFFMKVAGKKSGDFNLFGGGSASDEAVKIQNDIQKIEQDLSIIVNAQTELLAKLTDILGGIKDTTEETTEMVREHSTEMLMFKKDVEAQALAAQKEIDGIIHQLKMQDVHNHQMGEALRESLSKILTSTTNMLTQLEKTDEFAKAFVPEFRSYHKELGKDITQLSKDIALMERSVQTQINNHNALKLR